MIKNRNIICIASNWFYDPTSKHHVMRELSMHNRIIWVNYHASRRPRMNAADAGAIAGKLRQFVEGPRRVAENITVITPLVVPLPGNRAVRALNRRLLVRQIRNVLNTLPPRPTQLWSFAPDVDFLCGQFDEEAIVYYCVDEFSEFTGYDRTEILRTESILAARADLVVTTSSTLYESKRQLNANTILLPHGVEVDHFATALDRSQPIPDELAALPRPRLGFWGLFQDWVDIDLLAALARARPDWSLVFIGEAATDIGDLANLPNVHLLGRRPYAQLPAYARGLDVGLIPFRLNDLTRAVNPIKLREYLAAGLPVVSTPLPEVIRYSSLVEIANDATDFVAACERAMRRTDGPARQTAMRAETWTAKVEHLCEALTLRSRRAPASVASP